MPVLLGLLSEIVDPVITEQMLPGKTYQDAEGFFFLDRFGTGKRGHVWQLL